MLIKDLKRHLFCNVELNYYTDGTMALECNSCNKTVLLFCGSACNQIVIRSVSFEGKNKRIGPKTKPKKNARHRKKRSKEFQQRVKAFCDYHNKQIRKPLDFDEIKPSDYCVDTSATIDPMFEND